MYEDLTNKEVECTEHKKKMCWECLAIHHKDETTKLLNENSLLRQSHYLILNYVDGSKISYSAQA